MRGCACRGTAGFVHLSCLAEQAKILVAEGLENNLAFDERWDRWHMCSLCEQRYHGVVKWALGWACWKTYLSRPEGDTLQFSAMRLLGNGLSEAEHHQDALNVRVAELAMRRRLGDSEHNMLSTQTNLACSYQDVGRHEEALRLRRDEYSGRLRLDGEEHVETLRAASNYANSLNHLHCFEEAKKLFLKTLPVARRIVGDSHELTLKMRWINAMALYKADGATLGDLREAVTTLEDSERIARRVMGGAHPLTGALEEHLRDAQVVLHFREANGEA